MEKYADLIFKKLHSGLSREESNLFDKLYTENQAFKLSYEKQKFVDQSIEKSEMVDAPKELNSAVLNVLFKQHSYSQSYTSFNGIKYIIGGLLSLCLLLTIFFLTNNGTTNTKPDVVARYMDLDKILETCTFNFDLNILPLALIFITGLLVVWVDSIFQNKIIGYRKTY